MDFRTKGGIMEKLPNKILYVCERVWICVRVEKNCKHRIGMLKSIFRNGNSVAWNKIIYKYEVNMQHVLFFMKFKDYKLVGKKLTSVGYITHKWK